MLRRSRLEARRAAPRRPARRRHRESRCRDSRAPRAARPRRTAPSPSRSACSTLLARAQAATSSASVALSRSGPRNAKRPLEAAVLVEDDAGRDQRRPGQMVGEPVGAVAIFARGSACEHALLAEVAGEHRREVGIALGGEHARACGRRAQSDEPGDPLLEAEPERGGDRAVDDGDRRAARRRAGSARSSDRWSGASKPSICWPAPITRSAPRRRS